jgi:general secretion pathway protein K
MAALWLLVAFAAIGLELGLRSRAARLGIANRIETTRVLAAADGGLQEARARLTRGLVAGQDARSTDAETMLDPWRTPQRLFRDSLRLGGVHVRVRISDAGAALDLNTADVDELRRLFGALRVDFGQADRLAQAIADWRDPDNLRRARGAEAADYARAGLTTRPGNRPFARLIELAEVFGMTPALYAKISPFLTVRGAGRVNLNAAPRPVLLALPGMSEETVRVLLGRRAAGRPVHQLGELSLALTSGARELLLANQVALMNRTTFDTRDVVVTSEGWLDGSPVRARVEAEMVRAGGEAVVVWTGTPR